MTQELVVGHAHCATCGICLINGYTQKSHPCLKLIDPEVAEVMALDIMGTAEQSRWRNRIEF